MKKKIDALLCELATHFKNRHYALVTAESCTGGGLAYFISNNPQCSSILERGYVVYSNMAKENLLEVSNYTIQTCGAVSKEVAIEMAEGALKNSNAIISVAITGVDQTADENQKATAGVVWIACAGINKPTLTHVFKHKGNRSKFCDAVIIDALKLLLAFVSK